MTNDPWRGGRVLITGANGFVGRHLVATLECAGVEVIAANNGDGCDLRLDLRSASSIRNALASTKPATIINLAAIADPRQANADPELAYDVNVVGQLRLILGMRDIIPHARLLVVGSALEYGRDSSGRILSEDDPLRPEGVYAVTKAAADLQAYQHHLSDGLDIIRVRPFNIIGPGRPEAYFPAPQIRQVAEILDHGAPPIIRTLGLSDALDFVDVRDAASALQVLVARGTTGEAYNVASGRVTPLRTVVDRLVSIADLKVEVIEDRTASQSKGWIVAGDPSKIARDTGWCPARSLDESLRDSLNHVREQLASRIPTAV